MIYPLLENCSNKMHDPDLLSGKKEQNVPALANTIIFIQKELIILQPVYNRFLVQKQNLIPARVGQVFMPR